MAESLKQSRANPFYRQTERKNLSRDFPKAWVSVQQTVERGSGPAYDEACKALVDLSEAYALKGNRETFRQALEKFMANHIRRKALIQRMVKAGIWEDI